MMNTYRTLYLMVLEKVKQLKNVVYEQGRILEEQKRVLQEKDILIEELKRRLKLK